MRFSVRHRLDARLLVAGLALIVLASGLLAYGAWQASVRRHETAVELMRSHAQLVAQRIASRLQRDLYLGGTAVFRGVLGGRFAAGDSVPPASVVLDGARAAEGCKCAPVLRPAYAFRTDLESGAMLVAGDMTPSDDERAFIERAIAEQRQMLRGGWDVAALRGGPSLRGRIVFFTHAAPGRIAPVYVGFATDSAALRKWIVRPLLKDTPLLISGAESPDLYADSLVAIRITDVGGQQLFGTTTAPDSVAGYSLPLGPEWGNLVITTSILPSAARLLVTGGAPRSPLPFLIGLSLAAATLLGVGIVLLWRMHEISRLRNDFTSSVSHELRTPLTQILLYAETIEMQRHQSRAQHAQAIRVITRETRRLIQLVENVLHFSRTERSLARIEPHPHDVATLVAETIEAFIPVADSRNVAVALRAPEPAWAAVDGEAVKRILVNLLDNAVRYGPSGQTVLVSVDRDGDSVRVNVEDEGPGVAASARESIWRPFVRLATPGERAGTGCGIGLAIVHELVAQHGGRCGVESRTGRGARFFVEFPAVPVPIARQEAAAAARS